MVAPVLLYFASTSGGTAAIATIIADELGKKFVECVDIGRSEHLPNDSRRVLTIFASPTYGQGDWHYAWSEKGAEISAGLRKGQSVALLCLGDARTHGQSFAGALAKLHCLISASPVRLIGQTPSDGYVFEFSPANQVGAFPGLVLEYRRNRYSASDKARFWAQRIWKIASGGTSGD